MRNKVLIFGGAGFIGLGIAKFLMKQEIVKLPLLGIQISMNLVVKSIAVGSKTRMILNSSTLIFERSSRSRLGDLSVCRS